MINVLNVNAYNEDSNMNQVSDVGDGEMITKKDVADAINEHNLSTSAHPDIREKMVTSVNETLPDENGNVELSVVTSVNNTLPDEDGNVSITIPTVNNGTLTIQKNGTDVQTFTANSSSSVTANISVPTDTNDLTNGAGFITSSALTSYQLIAQDMKSLSSIGNTLSLSDNTIYKVTANGATTFSLPTITDLTKFHQIFIELNMSSVYTITLGTTYYFNKTAPDLSSAGTYNLYYEYDNTESHWVVGAIPKGSAS